jgi:hypothetical protein
MESDKLKSVQQQYKEDPIAYFENRLGIMPWLGQKNILESLLVHDRVAVRSGHKVGKSNSAAGIALWWLETRQHAKVAMTSATYNQVKKILWKEIRSQSRKMRPRLGVNIPLDPKTGINLPDGREIFGFATNEVENAAGFSSPEILYIIDEASAQSIDDIFEAIEGNLAGGGKVIMFSNPTRTSGVFYEAFHAGRASWHCIHIASSSTPNATTGDAIIPGLATRAWVEDKKMQWGVDSPLYQVRVQGNFPSQGERSVIPLWLVEEARGRYADVNFAGALVLGVDVARDGDDESVIYPVRGYKAGKPITFRNLDGNQLAGRVLEFGKSLQIANERIVVNIDVIGIGASLFDALRLITSENKLNWVVNGVNVAHKSDDDAMYFNLRTQLAFGLRDWLKEGGTIPDDSLLEGEMVAVEYIFDSRGRYKLPDKSDEKKRLKRSPDRRNALELATYSPKIEFKMPPMAFSFPR